MKKAIIDILGSVAVVLFIVFLIQLSLGLLAFYLMWMGERGL